MGAQENLGRDRGKAARDGLKHLLTGDKARQRVVCLGTVVLDVFLRPVVSLPAAERLELVEQLEVHAGGCANNSAIGLSRLGHTADAIGKVGKDIFGDYIVRELKRERVGVKGMRRSSHTSTSTTLVLVDPSGQRGLIHYKGANAELSMEDLDFYLIEGAGLLHIAGANLLPKLDGDPMAEILSRAKKSNVVTSLDTSWSPDVDFIKSVGPSLPHTDIFLPNIHEASRISKLTLPSDIARFLLDRGVHIVGLKMGRAGCFVANREEMFHMPTFDANTIDTAGAGDAFVAGFLSGILRGLPLRETARLANAMGALATTAIGCTTALPTWKEVTSFIESASLLTT